jgi:arylsulfatase
MHPPMMANPNFAGKSTERGGAFADIIAEMDFRVGQIVDAVKEAGIDDNTIIILSSDNGGGGTSRKPGQVRAALPRQFLQHAV